LHFEFKFCKEEKEKERGRDLRERIDGEFGNGEKFIRRNETTVVAIELTKTLVK